MSGWRDLQGILPRVEGQPSATDILRASRDGGEQALAERDRARGLACALEEELAAVVEALRAATHREFCMDLGPDPDGDGFLRCDEWNAHPANCGEPTALCVACAARVALAALAGSEIADIGGRL